VRCDSVQPRTARPAQVRRRQRLVPRHDRLGARAGAHLCRAAPKRARPVL